MSALLANVVFLQPWILSALLALPVLWYLLRVTPPAPRVVSFPATRFLAGLVSEEQTPSKTPWWVLLLRLLIAGLIIVALARPVFNPAEGIAGSGPARLVIDNGWAGAQTWTAQIEAAEEALKQASREEREIFILTTAPQPGERLPLHRGPMAYQEAVSVLRGLSPQPWPGDLKAAGEALAALDPPQSVSSLWFGHGLDEGGMRPFAQALQAQGSLRYTGPEAARLPILLRPADESGSAPDAKPGTFKLSLEAPESVPAGFPAAIQAVSRAGQILDVTNATLGAGGKPTLVSFDMAERLRADTMLFRVGGLRGAGAALLTDDQFVRRHVGIAEPAEDSDTAPLVKAGFYLRRALEPHAQITTDTIDALLKVRDLSTIILPDVGAMPLDTLNALEQWVKDGGLLLRFSGPKLSEAQGEQYLLPVRLRAGGRALEGSLSWDKPQAIAPFAEDSPLYGLAIPPEVRVRRQVLADPAQDLDGKVWARLEDGTPLITGTALERGLVVLVHTTATPDWSDLALSGLYVDLLRRIGTLAGRPLSKSMQGKQNFLDPVQTLDGYGNPGPPPAYVQSLPAEAPEKAVPDSLHPPGLYGSGGVQFALNLGNALPPLRKAALPASVEHKFYETEYEVDLTPSLLYGALMIYFADWLVMILILSGGFAALTARAGRRMAAIAVTMAIALNANPALAADTADISEAEIKYANGFYLAYVQSGDSAVDAVTQRGLESLSDILIRRSSAEPDGIVGVNPETDDLAFFPVLYWAVAPGKTPYSGKAMQNVQNYLDHGGTILFDTRDGGRGPGGSAETESARTLRKITETLSIPPLIPVSKDHALTRSFYLMEKFPGRSTDGTVWVEQHSAGGRDDVSSVIIGGNDWAGCWADSGAGNMRSPVFGRSRQEELCLRFGVNLVMYALTGNYKNDQVHLPHILRRLDQ